jgi:hypothetical protein
MENDNVLKDVDTLEDYKLFFTDQNSIIWNQMTKNFIANYKLILNQYL